MFIMKTIVLLLLSTAVAIATVPDESARSIHRELRKGSSKRDHIFKPQYYTLTRDLRACMFPLCGGYFIQALNQEKTECYDGKKSREGCYVAALDLSSTGLDQSQFFETITSSGGGAVLGSYKLTAYPDPEGRFADLADLAVEGAWVSLVEATRSVSRFCDCDANPNPNPNDFECNCGRGEVCVDDPNDRCLGCGCPTTCRKYFPIDCSGGGECPPNLECIVENPFCGGDDCKSTCVAFDERKSPCGGSDESNCLPGQICTYQDCNPEIDDECEGVCVQKIGAFCGGIAGIRCGLGLTCVDPLGDGCDNLCNGADCGGVCLPDLVLQLGGE
jgi:hypothetical protein